MNSQVVANPLVIVVMGVSGTGKSTIAAMLAEQLGWDWADGDDLHPTVNVAKMSSGAPLTDADRWPWLDLVAAWIQQHLTAGRSGVIVCSALRRTYRDRLRLPGVVFLHLAGSRELIGSRLGARAGHFFPSRLLDSQFAALQPPDPDENAVEVSIAATPTEIVESALRQLRLLS